MKKLESKASKFKAMLHKMDRFYPSSKTCCNCQHIKEDLSLKDRIYECLRCGIKINRDKNASININMANSRKPGQKGFVPEVFRWAVERTFAWLSRQNSLLMIIF